MLPSPRSSLITCSCVLTILLAGTSSHFAHEPSAAPPPAAAQSTLAGNAPRLLGTVMPLDANGTIVVRPEGHVTATGHTPLTNGDIVRTGVNASAMIVLANHTILLMLERTEIEMRGPSRLRLSDGYVTVILDEWPRMLTLPMPDNNALLTVDVPHGVITLTAAGDYDLDVEARTPATSSALVTVHAGLAQLTALKTDVDGRDSLDRVHELSLGQNQSGLLRAGTIPVMMPPTLSPHRVATDAFVRLTRSLRDFRGRAPTQYANWPAELLRYMWLLEGHGSWMWDADYGPTWVPYVKPKWQPYTDGEWVNDSEFGWMWNSRERWWGPLTHNLGHWRSDRFSRWVWQPGREWVRRGNDPQVTPARLRQAWQRQAVVERERFRAEERVRNQRTREDADTYAPPRHGSSADGYSSGYDGSYSSDSSSSSDYSSSYSSSSSSSSSDSSSSSSSAPARHGSSSSSSSSSSSGSSGAVPRDSGSSSSSSSSKAPPRHGSKP